MKTLTKETIKPKNKMLSAILQQKSFAWIIVATSVILMFIDNFLKLSNIVGLWNIVGYIVTTIPLIYLTTKGKVKNRYTKYFLPILAILIFDMFYFNNKFTQTYLPIIFYILIFMLYLNSMDKTQELYKTLKPSFNIEITPRESIQNFFLNLFSKSIERTLIKRVAISIAISLPFLIVFTYLLLSADSNYSNFLSSLVSSDIDFEPRYIITVPLSFFIYLSIFLYTISNSSNNQQNKGAKALDSIIVGIFLTLINLLFVSFVAINIPFLLDKNSIQDGINIANFAREGFFQLMAVMAIVSLIFLFILNRYRGERVVKYLQILLLLQTVAIGVISIKKMNLYQDIMGATALRYYVEWFDYFLLLVLILGAIFILLNLKFTKLLNTITISSMVALAIVSSINTDALIAKTNIDKFKKQPKKLDKLYLSQLSIDALPIIKKSKIELNRPNWHIEENRDNCTTIKGYHLGYCNILKEFK